MSETKRVVGRGRVVCYGDAVGLRLPEGAVWYPDQDLGDYVGEEVQVTIERMGPERATRVLGFRPPVPTQRPARQPKKTRPRRR